MPPVGGSMQAAGGMGLNDPPGSRAQAVTPEAHEHTEMAGHATATLSEVGGGGIGEGNVAQVEADDHTVLVAATRHPDGDDGRCRP